MNYLKYWPIHREWYETNNAWRCYSRPAKLGEWFLWVCKSIATEWRLRGVRKALTKRAHG